MISVTGGFNQQFVAGAPKVNKLKYAADTMAMSDAAVPVLAYVPDIEHSYSDSMSLSDSFAIQGGNRVAKDDTLEMTDAAEVELIS